MHKKIKKLYILWSMGVLFVLLLLMYGCSKKEVVIEKYETSIKENITETIPTTKETDDISDESFVKSDDISDDIIDSEYEVIPLRKGENKMVVTYCTFSGYTKKVAKMIENYYHKKGKVVDLYEIEPKKPYTEKDLDYMDKNSRCTREHEGDLRPELLDHDFNIDKHEVVFVGFPVWWGLSPQIVYSFLESYDFSGKTIVPFCTSHSSPLGDACDNLKNYTDADVLPGVRFSMEVKEEEVEEWLDGLDLK